MSVVFNDLEAYPEVHTWTLLNLYNNQEHLVTDSQLQDAFPNEMELMRIKSGRSKAWAVVENFKSTNAFNIL